MKESKILNIIDIKPNPFQPRIQFQDDALMDLAQSIRENGLIQPITVRKVNDGYEIVAGERRFRAMKLIGATEVPVIVMDADEVQMAELALVENIQRENLSAIEEAKAYVQIMKYSNLTQSQLALRMGKSQSSIANKIRLLSLDENVQNAVSNKMITERHARALIGMDKELQNESLDKILKKGLNVAQTEKLVKEKKEPVKKTVVKGFSKNVRIGINTIKQAYQMVSKTGIQIELKEIETEDDYQMIITFPKDTM